MHFFLLCFFINLNKFILKFFSFPKYLLGNYYKTKVFFKSFAASSFLSIHILKIQTGSFGGLTFLFGYV